MRLGIQPIKIGLSPFLNKDRVFFWNRRFLLISGQRPLRGGDRGAGPPPVAVLLLPAVPGLAEHAQLQRVLHPGPAGLGPPGHVGGGAHQAEEAGPQGTWRM